MFPCNHGRLLLVTTASRDALRHSALSLRWNYSLVWLQHNKLFSIFVKGYLAPQCDFYYLVPVYWKKEVQTRRSYRNERVTVLDWQILKVPWLEENKGLRTVNTEHLLSVSNCVASVKTELIYFSHLVSKWPGLWKDEENETASQTLSVRSWSGLCREHLTSLLMTEWTWWTRFVWSTVYP